MPALKRSDLVAPELPRETVAVPALGGDVIVRGLRLSERLALFAGLRTDADGRSYDHIAKLLIPPLDRNFLRRRKHKLTRHRIALLPAPASTTNSSRS